MFTPYPIRSSYSPFVSHIYFHGFIQEALGANLYAQKNIPRPSVWFKFKSLQITLFAFCICFLKNQ